MEESDGLIKLVLEDESCFSVYGSVQLIIEKESKIIKMRQPDYFEWFPNQVQSFFIKEGPFPELYLGFKTKSGTFFHTPLGGIPPHLLEEVNNFIHKANQLYQK